MSAYLDSVPFSGIIRIRDMMYTVDRPFRLDQGDVSFDAPDSLKNALIKGVHENRTHYVQTTGIPPLVDLLVKKLREKNRIPVGRKIGSPALALSALHSGSESRAMRV